MAGNIDWIRIHSLVGGKLNELAPGQPKRYGPMYLFETAPGKPRNPRFGGTQALLRKIVSDDLFTVYRGTASGGTSLSEPRDKQGPKGGDISQAEVAAQELQQERLQNRLDRQHDIYSWNTRTKRRIMKLMRRYNKEFAKNVRDFRKALKQLLRTAARNPDPISLAIAFRNLVMVIKAMFSMLGPMLAMMKGLARLNHEIKDASKLATENQLKNPIPPHLAEKLSSHLKMEMSLRNVGQTDPSSYLKVGRFMFTWTAQTVHDALSMIGIGIKALKRVIRLERRELTSKDKPVRMDKTINEQELMLKSIQSQHQRLSSTLHELLQSHAF